MSVTNKMRTLSVVVALACCLLSACGNMSESDIEEMTSSGVVLVQNESYYEVELSNGEKLFFSNYEEGNGIKGIATEEDSVEMATSYGTGFFVSDNGEIATNAHVVSNMVEDKAVNKSVSNVLEALKKITLSTYMEYRNQYDEAVEAYDYANRSDEVSYEDFYKIRDIKDALKEKCEEYAATYEALDEIDARDSEIKYHNRISIAYNDTYVTSATDFVGCVVTKVDAEHDLAIVQLKDKKTPDDKYIFEVRDEDPLEDYGWTENLTKKLSDDKNSKLFMTSFNLGPTLALTKEGIKSQFNSGTISQRTADRLMYSIPALPGSSGSPVVNLQGQLVAINFAGINTTQNFNYGIRVKHQRNLMEK